MQSAMRINRPPPSRSSNPIALAAVACAIALIAAFGAVWRGASAPAASPSSAESEAKHRRPTRRNGQIPPHQPQRRHRARRHPSRHSIEPKPLRSGLTRRASTSRAAKTTASGSEKGLVTCSPSRRGARCSSTARAREQRRLWRSSSCRLGVIRSNCAMDRASRTSTQVDVVPGRPLRISHLFQ